VKVKCSLCLIKHVDGRLGEHHSRSGGGDGRESVPAGNRTPVIHPHSLVTVVTTIPALLIVILQHFSFRSKTLMYFA